MTEARKTILLIKGTIAELPPHQAEACNELADNLRRACDAAGETVGKLALALVSAEQSEK